jgi:hypothetical protein
MLEDDCKQFLAFVQQQEPFVVVERSCKSEAIEEAQRPWERGKIYCLWNQAILPKLQGEFIQEAVADNPS